MPKFLGDLPGLRSRTVDRKFSTPHELYTVHKVLGEGAFGMVRKVKDRSSRKWLAMKVIPLDKVDGVEEISQELEIFKQLSHPYIASLHDVLVDEGNMYLLMDLCTGGDLLYFINTYWTGKAVPMEARLGGLPTEVVAKYMWQMVAGLVYLHHHRFCHRDIKCENYLLESKGQGADLKLIDFGLTRSFVKGVKMTEPVGTLHYVAPEVLQEKPYDEKVDIWSRQRRLQQRPSGFPSPLVRQAHWS